MLTVHWEERIHKTIRGKIMNYRARCVTVLGLLYKLWALLSNCLFCTSLLQSAKGQQNRKQSPLKPQTAQNISLLLPLSLKTPSKHRKKKKKQCSEKSKRFAFTGVCLRGHLFSYTVLSHETVYREQCRLRSASTQDLHCQVHLWREIKKCD